MSTLKISGAFPSQYLKCADLIEKPWDLKIRTVVMEDFGQGNDKKSKPVVHFDGDHKGLVLNKTNANNIVNSYGDDTFPTTTEFKGETVDAIRVRVVPEAQPEEQPDAAPMADGESDDEIPF